MLILGGKPVSVSRGMFTVPTRFPEGSVTTTESPFPFSSNGMDVGVGLSHWKQPVITMDRVGSLLMEGASGGWDGPNCPPRGEAEGIEVMEALEEREEEGCISGLLLGVGIDEVVTVGVGVLGGNDALVETVEEIVADLVGLPLLEGDVLELSDRDGLGDTLAPGERLVVLDTLTVGDTEGVRERVGVMEPVGDGVMEDDDEGLGIPDGVADGVMLGVDDTVDEAEADGSGGKQFSNSRYEGIDSSCSVERRVIIPSDASRSGLCGDTPAETILLDAIDTEFVTTRPPPPPPLPSSISIPSPPCAETDQASRSDPPLVQLLKITIPPAPPPPPTILG